MDGKAAMTILNKLYWETRTSGEPLGDLCFHMHPETQRTLELQYILINNSSPRNGFNDFMGVPFHVSEDMKPDCITLAPLDDEAVDHPDSDKAKRKDRL